jgi:predicted MPP superfamily phosphohydrolase
MALAFISILFLPIDLSYHSDYYIILYAILAILGVRQSSYSNFGNSVHIDLRERKSCEKLQRIQNLKIENMTEAPLKIFQMTDTHIGTFTSVNRLKRLCRIAVENNPDLILLTGDYYTAECRNNDEALSEALLPLKDFKGKVIACLGNHDYEQLEAIRFGLQNNGIILLEDQEVIVETRKGPVQILGTEFYFREAKENVERLFNKFPRNNNVKLHLTLLHNPSHFQFIKDGKTDLVLSGHYHGYII